MAFRGFDKMVRLSKLCLDGNTLPLNAPEAPQTATLALRIGTDSNNILLGCRDAVGPDNRKPNIGPIWGRMK
jgi:hypothetical protein